MNAATKVNTDGLTFHVINSRASTPAAVASFMLRSDAEKFVTVLHSREGCNGDTYQVVLA